MTPADPVIDTKQALRGMFEDMRAIGTTSARIGEVVHALNETAFRTSLFALASNVGTSPESVDFGTQSEAILEEERELVGVVTRSASTREMR